MRAKQLEVVWDPVARTDLLLTVEYIAQDNVDSATHLLNSVKKAAKLIAFYPERGRIVPELKEYGNKDYREIILDYWRLVYKIEKQRAVIVAFIDGRRDVEDLLFDRLIREENF